MTIDELRRFLDGVVMMTRRGDAEVLVWDRHSQGNVSIEQVTFGAGGTVYVMGEFVEWNEKLKVWQ